MKFQNLEFNYRNSVVNDELYIIFNFFKTHLQNCEKRPPASSCPSVRPPQTTRFPLDGFSWNFVFEYFSKIRWKKFQFHWNLIRITGTLHENLRTFLIISHSVPRKMRNVSDKLCRENQNIHLVVSIFFPLENRTIYEIMWKNTLESVSPQMSL